MIGEPDFQQGFEEDAQKEKDFLVAVKDLAIPEAVVTTEIKCMVDAYNEQIVSLPRLKFDIRIFEELIVLAPNMKQYETDKTQAINALKQKRVAVAIIRGQIVEKLKLLK